MLTVYNFITIPIDKICLKDSFKNFADFQNRFFPDFGSKLNICVILVLKDLFDLEC